MIGAPANPMAGPAWWRVPGDGDGPCGACPLDTGGECPECGLVISREWAQDRAQEAAHLAALTARWDRERRLEARVLAMAGMHPCELLDDELPF